MKKFTAVLLALVIALSCATIGFAADSENSLTCPYCGNTFTDEKAYDDHIEICYSQKGGNPTDTAHTNYADYDKFFNLDLNTVLDKLIETFKIDASWWDGVESIVLRLIDLIENFALGSQEEDVAGAVDELEAKVAQLPIVGDVLTYIHNLITTLKQKIKDLYSGNKETEIEETVAETEAEYTADTGSSSIGIAAFAAVSAAAAAAFVCMKKKEN